MEKIIWLYWIFEGLTEAIATDDNPNLYTKKQQDRYHIFRLVETLSIFGIIWLINGSFPLFAVRYSVSGIALYEFAFSWLKYGNPLHNKKSKWFFIPHPKGWMWIVIFIIGLLWKS